MTDSFHPTGLDSMFVPYVNGSVVARLSNVLEFFTIISNLLPDFGIATLWIPSAFYNIDVSLINSHTPDS